MKSPRSMDLGFRADTLVGEMFRKWNYGRLANGVHQVIHRQQAASEVSVPQLGDVFCGDGKV